MYLHPARRGRWKPGEEKGGTVPEGGKSGRVQQRPSYWQTPAKPSDPAGCCPLALFSYALFLRAARDTQGGTPRLRGPERSSQWQPGPGGLGRGSDAGLRFRNARGWAVHVTPGAEAG